MKNPVTFELLVGAFGHLSTPNANPYPLFRYHMKGNSTVKGI